MAQTRGRTKRSAASNPDPLKKTRRPGPAPLDLSRRLSGSRKSSTPSPLRSAIKSKGPISKQKRPISFNQHQYYDDGTQTSLDSSNLGSDRDGSGLGYSGTDPLGPRPSTGPVFHPDALLKSPRPGPSPTDPGPNPRYESDSWTPSYGLSPTPMGLPPSSPSASVSPQITRGLATRPEPPGITGSSRTQKTEVLDERDFGKTRFPSPKPVSGGELLAEIAEKPRALRIDEASAGLNFVRHKLHAFTSTFFAYPLSQAEKRAFPLADLKDRHPELAAAAAYIADGSQYGWRALFTEEYSRPHLVAALVGHWLVEHVFKHTGFGLCGASVRTIEDEALRKYILYDGFARAKLLAAEVRSILDAYDASPDPPRLNREVQSACTHLAAQMLTALQPLLPPGPAAVTDASESVSATTTPPPQSLQAALHALLTHAAYLSLSLRLTGANRTIVRFSFPEKHTPIQVSLPTQHGRQSCLNAERVAATAHHVGLYTDDDGDDDCLVKFAAWPNIIATVPTGPDMLDFAADPALIRRYDVDWTSPTAAQLRALAHSPGGIYGGVPIPPAAGVPPDNPGAFVTEYLVSSADVYCEWTPRSQPQLRRLTLAQAIDEAKQEERMSRGRHRHRHGRLHRRGRLALGAVATAVATAGLLTGCSSALRGGLWSLDLLQGCRHMLATAQQRTKALAAGPLER